MSLSIVDKIRSCLQKYKNKLINRNKNGSCSIKILTILLFFSLFAPNGELLLTITKKTLSHLRAINYIGLQSLLSELTTFRLFLLSPKPLYSLFLVNGFT